MRNFFAQADCGWIDPVQYLPTELFIRLPTAWIRQLIANSIKLMRIISQQLTYQLWKGGIFFW